MRSYEQSYSESLSTSHLELHKGTLSYDINDIIASESFTQKLIFNVN